MPDLMKLVAEYEELDKRANESLEGKPAKFMPGLVAAQRDARLRFDEVKAEYAGYVKEAAVAIILTGNQEDCQSFATVAEEEAETLTANARAVYERLAEHIEPTIGARREFGTTQLGVLVGAISSIGREFDIKNVPTPTLFDMMKVTTPDATIEQIRSLTRSVIADRFTLADIDAQVLKGAIKNRYSKSVIPVVIVGTSQQEEVEALKEQLFSGSNYVLRVPRDVTPDQVLKSFEQIRGDLIKKKSKQQQKKKQE